MKKKTKTTIIIILFILAIAGSILFFMPIGQTSGINTGGGVYFDVDLPDVLFDPQDTSLIEVPYTMKIYFGLGWDEICFQLATVYWVEDADGQVMDSNVIKQNVVVHDSDRKNKPFTTSNKMIVPISHYENGKYTIYMENYISTLDDIDNFACDTIPRWEETLSLADSTANIKTNPEAWMQVLIDDPFVLEEGSYKTRFVIQGYEAPDEPDDPIDPPPINGGNIPTVIIIAIIVLFLILVLYLRTKKTRK